MIRNFFNQIVCNFGFTCTGDFSNSIVHSKLMAITIPFAGVSAIAETIFGLHSFTIMAFAVLVVLELLTGLIASKVRGEQIVSHKFGRFGLKVLVWMTLLYITNSMRLEYIDNDTNFGGLASTFFTWLHGTFFIYITIEYLISVLENLGVITGDSKRSLINTIINKLNSFLGNEKNKRKDERN